MSERAALSRPSRREARDPPRQRECLRCACAGKADRSGLVSKSPRLLSPSRLNDFLGCEHRTHLDLLAERGEIPREDHLQPDAELLLERGRRHEEAFLQSLRDEGRDVVSLEGPPIDRSVATETAMRAGR